MGNIGEPEKWIELEPFQEPGTVPEPVKTPTKQPEPEKVPA